jgi:hypothetical protein
MIMQLEYFIARCMLWEVINAFKQYRVCCPCISVLVFRQVRCTISIVVIYFELLMSFFVGFDAYTELCTYFSYNFYDIYNLTY